MSKHVTTLRGYLMDDPQVSIPADSYIKAKFYVSVFERMAEGKPVTTVFPCEAWGKFAELVRDQAFKGCYVHIVAGYKTSQYKDGQGTQQYRHVFDVREFEVLRPPAEKKHLPN
jgi:single-stranded DNA-binding protein